MLRKVAAGGSLRLVDGTVVPVSGVVEDAAIGGYEVALSDDRARPLGISRLAYLLVKPPRPHHPRPVAAAVRRSLSTRTVRVRLPGDRPRISPDALPGIRARRVHRALAGHRTCAQPTAKIGYRSAARRAR